MNINALLLASLFATANLASAVNTEPILKELSQFSFPDGKSAAEWGHRVMELKKRHDAGEEEALKLVAELYEAWEDEFAKYLRSDKLDISESHKMASFVENMWGAAKTNIRNLDSKDQPWWQSLNRFANLNWDDFQEHFLMKEFKIPDKTEIIDISKIQFADCVDWDTNGQLTPVKNQGACGSCWAFSAAAAKESNYLIKKGKTYAANPIDLSEQQLVDCVRSPRTDTTGSAYSSRGCNGGHSYQAFDFIHKYGLYKESKYPYTASDGTCTLDFRWSTEMKGTGSAPGWGRLSPSSDVGAIKTALNKQTLSHYLRVEQPFQLYNGGVFSTPCTGDGINHATLLYGYCDYYFDQLGFGTDVWKIKNSWGEGWGEDGKMRMAIQGGDGICEAQKYVWVDEDADFKFNGKLKLPIGK